MNENSSQCPECGSYVAFEPHLDTCKLKPSVHIDAVSATKDALRAKKNEYMRNYMKAYRAKKKADKDAPSVPAG